jgi:hypothetical protein
MSRYHVSKLRWPNLPNPWMVARDWPTGSIIGLYVTHDRALKVACSAVDAESAWRRIRASLEPPT